MITVYPYETLGAANHGWLQARHHFSFANYYNPERMHFGVLRVVNDDRIQAGSGFGAHPHRNMEIITYVRQGAITHQDNLGNRGRTAAGDVQVMSAGRGIQHAEYNLETEETTLYQIWIEPNTTNVEPRWETRTFPANPVWDALPALASGYREDIHQGALMIYQSAVIRGGRLAKGTHIEQPLRHPAYVLVSEGAIQLDTHPLKKGDGAEVRATNTLSLTATTDAEVLVIEVPDR
jgi:redox-sensitive bicupin YhaK (pirin superfamily)